jgi:alkyldihydroxyacetonephosphate synthase
MTKPSMPNEYPGGAFQSLVPDPAPPALLHDLTEAGLDYDVTISARADHARDWWPVTIPQVAAGVVEHWPGVVVRPATTDDVSRLLSIASRHGVAVTAQGGRSSVVGGAVVPSGGIALDLTGLDRVLDIDTVSGTVAVEAGVFGPDLERAVRATGWTVGHLPQSFDLATVGGWIACRGAGQYSNRYGKIEDIVRALTVVLANGDIVELGGRSPRQAVGPDLMALFIGSEGTLGVITRATLVMHPVAPAERRAAFSFASFSDGLEVCRRIMQRDARPAVLRLYDATESKRNFDVDQCVLVVLDEGDELLVNATMTIVEQECHQATSLSVDVVASWLAHRNDVGSLAPLWEHGVVVDTIEVAGPWVVLAALHQRVTTALLALPDMMIASVHQSHAYLDGACLYFTFAGRPSTALTEFYRMAWDVATNEVLEGGGSLSHHHGVGRNRARFVERAMATAFPVLTALKDQFDPLHVMNPGVLGLGAPPW